jgi:hypothetical protein
MASEPNAQNLERLVLTSSKRKAVMQRTSESIGALAGALAKAQIELVNPDKSLVATIREEGARGREQTFRYAPLSSGLEIVRKVLGQQEIATVQSTSIDQAAGTVNLTTLLAHSSGEWIASDWPVCAVNETASPRRMGAALTYARRYALFALVGIAGEDDLDAPDLNTPIDRTGAERPRANGGGQQNNGRQHSPEQVTPRRDQKFAPKGATAMLGLHASAILRERLIAELNDLGSGEDAAKWAHQRLAEKNRLRALDANRVEVIFEAKLAALAASAGDGSQSREKRPVDANAWDAKRFSERPPGKAIDKSALALPELRRIRDRDHVRFVAKQPCLICGRLPSDAHHLRFAQSRALGRKVSDEFTVPLCRGHHRELHRSDEGAWWQKAGCDPIVTARALWLDTHPPTPDKPPADDAGLGGQEPHSEATPVAQAVDLGTR